MYLAVTIDTEEDDWGQFSNNKYTSKNIEQIPLLQEIFNKYNITPTYLITYAVATDDISVGILRKIVNRDRCEIGAHLHPWNTPPLREEKNEINSYVNNLSPDLQFKKIKMLKETIKKNFGVEALSYRSGRWGFNHDIAVNLYKLGFLVDSSVTPYTNWSAYNGPDYSDIALGVRKIHIDINPNSQINPYILEIPPTVGYTRKNFELCNSIYSQLSRFHLEKFPIGSCLHRLNLVNKVFLSPEGQKLNEMIQLARRVKENGHNILNMSFHSTSLVPGLSPFVKNNDEKQAFIEKLENFIQFSKEEHMVSGKLSTLATYNLTNCS